MSILFTVLFAFALGYFVRPRGLAVLTYLALAAIVFSFQSLWVLLSWLADEPPVAFGPSPKGFPVEYSTSQMWGYGVLNLVVIMAGIGLVLLGHWVSAHRAARRTAVSVA